MDVTVRANVKLGGGSEIGMFSIIGEPPRGKKEGELSTAIGKDANIRSHSVIYAGSIIGDRLETGHRVMIRENCAIGSDVSIGTGAVLERDCRIGNGVRMHSLAFIPEYSDIKDGAWIGPGVTLTNAPYPKSPHAKEHLLGVTVGENAKIGANVTVLPGVTIGKDSLVGAGSVVTRDVPPGAVVAGNPAKKINEVANLAFDSGEKAY